MTPVSTESAAGRPRKASRGRMTAAARREQLIDIARGLFAERGYDGASIEEVAARAGVSKPVVYEHFGGKEGLYAVVVDREVRGLLTMMQAALTSGHPRELLEQAAFALLDYIEESSDGFRILVRDSPIGSASGSFVSIIGDIASRVEYILAAEFRSRGFDADAAPMYAQMLVGMVGTTGQWWLDTRKPPKDVVAAHLVNLAWHGLSGLDKAPSLRTR
ncbi:MAG TPA: TetR/AcrR family transcriptional regulator [Nocardioidaceae bacterium]|jgi:AcrR family transcriptional regulator